MSSPARPSTLRSLALAMTSWRTAAVTLLSFSSGLPLGLVWIAIPDWMRSIGVDIRVVGMITLAQAPWTFKFLWSPFMDRYAPPFLGRRRGWTAIAQVALFAGTLALAGVHSHPDAAWVVGALALAIAFAAATQDIAIDAYVVDVLRPEEQGMAVGARIAVYRGAMFVAGGLSITLAGQYSWRLVCVGLALLYAPMLVVTLLAPEPEERVQPPKSLKDAVWLPFLGFLSRHRALEILAFVVLYKLADNLSGSLLRPFLVDMQYDEFHRGVALATVALVGTIAGTLAGGICTTWMGLGHSLWVFGILQMVSNIGYILIARQEAPNLPIMYGALAFEQVTQGLGTGAFSVLLLRLTQKRFSATQYALFTSLFGIPRVLAGPVSGFLVYSLDWELFFWVTIFAGIPGMVLLARFVPLGVREPAFTVRADAGTARPISRAGLLASSIAGAVLGAISGWLVTALLTALKAFRNTKRPVEAVEGTLVERVLAWFGNDYAVALTKVLQPEKLTDWVTIAGIVAFGLVVGLFTAAVLAARSGAVATDDQPKG